MNTSKSKLYSLAKNKEFLLESEKFLESLSLVQSYLEDDDNQSIHMALQKAEDKDNEKAYNIIKSLLLTSIHTIHYNLENKEKNSTLFVVPYFSISEDKNINYPQASQIQNIFRKHFSQFKLIDNPESLFLANLKLHESEVYDLDYSDWYAIHKLAIQDSIAPEPSEAEVLEIEDEGELNFFCITVQTDSEATPPLICSEGFKDQDLDALLDAISEEINILSGHGKFILSVPTDFEKALTFGLETEQDFSLQQFFNHNAHKKNINFVITPLSTDDLCLLAWHEDNMQVVDYIALNYYSEDDKDFLNNLIQQISFHNIEKSYLFLEMINLFDIDQMDKFDLEDATDKFQHITISNEDNQYNNTLH